MNSFLLIVYCLFVVLLVRHLPMALAIIIGFFLLLGAFLLLVIIGGNRKEYRNEE